MAVLFDPFDKQKQYLDAVFSLKHRYLLYGGGVGGGKSYAVLGTMLSLLVVYPGSKGICIRDTYPNLQQTSIESWNKLIHDEVGPNSFIRSYNQTERIFYCANGSQLQFIAEDFANKKDLGHFMGLEYNFAILEECQTLQEQTFHKAIERCGRWLPPSGSIPPPIIMLTCNPTNNFVRRIFYDPFMTGTLTQDYYFLPALIEDNKYLMANQAYIDSTKANMPAYLYRKFFLGDWDISEPTEGRIYRCFNPDRDIAELKYNPDLPLMISVDDNVNPYMSLVIFQVTLEKDNAGKNIRTNINLIDEILGKDPMNTVEGITTLFKNKYPAHQAGVYVFGDASARKSDTKLEKGHNLYTLFEGFLKQYLPVNKVLKSNASVMLRTGFIDTIFEKNFNGLHLLIDTRCNNTINDFLGTQVDQDGSKLKKSVQDPQTKISSQPFGHLTDCVEYFITSWFAKDFGDYQRGGRKETPITYGRNPGSRFSYDTPNTPKVTRVSKFRPSNY